MRLVTCESATKNIDDIKRALSELPRCTTRVIHQYDENEGAWKGNEKDTADTVKSLAEVTDVMLCFADSSAIAHYTEQQIGEITQRLLQQCRPKVRWGEVNEVNGEWCGKNAIDKWRVILQRCLHSNLAAAVTYFYPGDNPDHMWKWIRKNALNTSVKLRLLSWYPNCYEDKKTRPGWNGLFNQFHRVFPTDQFGFGEYGTENDAGKNPSTEVERGLLVQEMEQLIGNMSGDWLKPWWWGGGGYWDWQADAAEGSRWLLPIYKQLWRKQ